MPKPAGRPRLGGDGRKPRRFLRHQYPYDFKLDVINYFRATSSVADTLNRYFPDVADPSNSNKRKLLYKWEKQRDLIEISARSTTRSGHCRHRPTGTGTILGAEIEHALVEWINDYRRDGVPISSLMLKMRARELAKEYGVAADAFAASYAWQTRFLKDHRLSFRAKTHQGQISPPDAIKRADAFAMEVRQKALTEGITELFNADQTGVFFEMLPRTTVSQVGASHVWIKSGKKEKERMTKMVLGDSAGNKYPLFIVMKAIPSRTATKQIENMQTRHGFGERLWEKVRPLQNKWNVQIYGNKHAWWNGDLTVEFLRFHFGDRSIFSPPIMLLLDDFSGHWVPKVVEYAASLHIVLMKVPPGLTWLCQPADAVWIKPLKDRLRRAWVLYLHGQLSKRRNMAATEPFEMQPPDRATVVEWAAKAWEDLPSSTIQAGFRKCKLDLEEHLEPLPETEEPVEMQSTIDAIIHDIISMSIINESACLVREQDDIIDAEEKEEPIQ